MKEKSVIKSIYQAGNLIREIEKRGLTVNSDYIDDNDSRPRYMVLYFSNFPQEVKKARKIMKEIEKAYALEEWEISGLQDVDGEEKENLLTIDFADPLTVFKTLGT